MASVPSTKTEPLVVILLELLFTTPIGIVVWGLLLLACIGATLASPLWWIGVTLCFILAALTFILMIRRAFVAANAAHADIQEAQYDIWPGTPL